MQASRSRVPWTVPLAFFLSGAAGLGYEVVWTRLFSVGLGHEYPALLAVVAAFFGGVALGAWLGDRPISRARRPGAIYGGLELVIGLWAFATIALIPLVDERAADWIGLDPGPLRHWTVAFLLPWLVLLPATAAMGATLPAIERLTARIGGHGRHVAGLYALNTAGAAAGILTSHLVLVPTLGLRASLFVLAACNLVCAALIGLGAARGESAREEVDAPMEDAPTARTVGGIAFATGLLGIGYEVLGIRVMAQVLENTVFSFAAALVAYLVGSAVGAGLYQARARKQRFVEPLERLLGAQVLACAVGIGVLSGAGGAYAAFRSVLGTGLGASLVAELSLAACVFGLPAAAMGAVFSHLLQAARRREGGVGRTLGLNTLGSALAPAVFGVGLLPLVGSKVSLTAIAAGYLALLPRRRREGLAWGVPALVLLALALPPLWLVDPAGGRLLEAREGRLAAVAVVEFDDGTRALKVNDRFRMGATGPGAFGARRLAHLPLMLHPEPRRALFLGLGTAVTFAAAADHPGLAADGVELVPEIVELAAWFRADNVGALDSERLSMHVGDARRYVRASDAAYDVVVADLFHPARDGAGALYAREHFAAVRDALAPDGLFCQWLPLFQMDAEVLAIVVATFRDVFPDAQAFLGWFNVETPTLGLVGGLRPGSFASDHFARRIEGRVELRMALERVALRDVVQLLGTWVGPLDALAAALGPAPVNTDDRPRVAYAAPAFAYRADDVPGQHLELLLGAGTASAEPWPTPDAPDRAEFVAALDAYRRARDLYLRAELAELEGDLERARELLLASALESGFFRTGYEALVAEARRLAPSRPELVRGWLDALERGRPERPDPKFLRQELFGGARR